MATIKFKVVKLSIFELWFLLLLYLLQLFKSNWKDINLNKNGRSTLLTSLLVEVSGVLSEV